MHKKMIRSISSSIFSVKVLFVHVWSERNIADKSLSIAFRLLLHNDRCDEASLMNNFGRQWRYKAFSLNMMGGATETADIPSRNIMGLKYRYVYGKNINHSNR